MKTLRAILAAFMLLTLATVPAFAEDNQQAKEQAGAGGTVTKTFQLTLYGSVPDDMSAVANFFTREQFEAGQHESTTIVLCGQVDEQDLGPETELVVGSTEDCAGGNGTIYSHDVELEAGTEIAYFFAAGPEDVSEDYDGSEDILIHASGFNENFEPTEYETVSTDMTNTAWYTFGTDDTQQVPNEMPVTGAGGLAGALPLGQAVALLTVLAVGAYAGSDGARPGTDSRC